VTIVRGKEDANHYWLEAISFILNSEESIVKSLKLTILERLRK
jgi:hypothetical protein